METFSVLLAICAVNAWVIGEFPTQRPMMRSFDVFYLRLNKRLSKQWWGWRFETQWRWLWRHCNAMQRPSNAELWLIFYVSLNKHLNKHFYRGQFWPSGIVIACVCVSVRVSVCLCVYQSLAYPHDNSSAFQARITKFGSEIQNTLVKMPIFLGGWSTLTIKVKFHLKIEFYLILSLSAR